MQIVVDQRQLDSVEYSNYFGSIVTNDARITREVKSRTVMAKAEFNEKKTLFSSKLYLNLRNELVKCWQTLR